MVADIIDLIDQATAPVCGWCQAELPPAGPSEFFCNAEHQFEWNRLRGEALSNYREPTDLAAHVSNQREEFSPEVTPPRRSLAGSFTSEVLRRWAASLGTCSHEGCRRPPTHQSWRCPLHAPAGHQPALAGEAVARALEALTRPPADQGGPPNTHTFTPGGPDGEDDHQSRPSFTVHEFDAIVVGPPAGVRGLPAALWLVDEAAGVAIAATRALREAAMLPEEQPADPRERALELRRRRNTGPQQRQRAPRRINPRGCL